jgi:pimeloyl-ACP methyl ester carboxylesterase
MLLLASLASIPRPPLWHSNLVDHFSPTSTTNYPQRYYEYDKHWAGPGAPIICIVGGEGAVPPSTGIFYPWVAETVAEQLHALVIQPEHRFYGASLPAGPPPFARDHLSLLSPQQALADTVHFIRAQQRARNCTARGTKGYCPVITVGGSYPGFLSAMMRLRYPAVVDAAYAASAPLAFYSQRVSWTAYYEKVTESAERSVAGCAGALRTAFAAFAAASASRLVRELGLCTPLPDYIANGGVETLREEVAMVVMYTFAGLNMGNYPPDHTAPLHAACQSVVAVPTIATLGALLHSYALSSRATALPRALPAPRHGSGGRGGCFELSSQLPAGPNATISSADWSGVGVGSDGESWDLQTCTFLVEAIGTDNVSDAFPPRPWSEGWLRAHCDARFGAVPQPTALADAWGFAPDALVGAGASRIVFTNGMNDGWSVGSITANLSESLVAINMLNGAHHSDLSHEPPSPADTPDVVAGRAQAARLLQRWLSEL